MALFWEEWKKCWSGRTAPLCLLALLAAAQRDGVWAETNSDPMFETYNTNVTLDVTDE